MPPLESLDYFFEQVIVALAQTFVVQEETSERLGRPFDRGCLRSLERLWIDEADLGGELGDLAIVD
jgi:hypothetical protein